MKKVLIIAECLAAQEKVAKLNHAGLTRSP